MVCIGIALVFWLLVKLSQRYNTQRPVTFHFEIPEDKTLGSAPPQDMTAEIEGTGWDLLFGYFSNPEIHLNYDLTETDGLELNRNQLRGDILRQLTTGDIVVSELNYDGLNLKLEDKVSRKVPIQLQPSISFAPEHHLREPIDLEPDSVEVTGPISQVTNINEWKTDSLILKNLKNDQNLTVPLIEPGREKSLSVSRVKVYIPVEQNTEKSVFVPLQVLNLPERDSLKYFPQRVRVTFVVGLSRYNQVTENDFELVANLQGTPIGEGRNRVAIELKEAPGFVKNIQYSPDTAEFFIVKEEEEQNPEE